MSESMPIFIVLSGKAFDVVLTRHDGTFLWPLIHMREHMCFKILKDLAAFGVWTPSLLGLITLEGAFLATI